MNDQSGVTYGGLLFGYDTSNVYLYAPTSTATGVHHATGSIINVGNGWGGEINAIQAQTASVRIMIYNCYMTQSKFFPGRCNPST